MVLPAGLTRETRISFISPNPKFKGSAARSRYESYMSATTVAQALDLGAYEADLANDYRLKFIKKTQQPSRTNQVPRRPACGSVATVAASSNRPFKHVQSLGTRCVISHTLENEGLRGYAGPFDWMYSTVDMVIDCLKNKFSKFLNKKMLTTTGCKGNMTGHKVYGPMLAKQQDTNTCSRIVFPHHNLLTKKDYEHFQRAAARFLKVLELGQRKLFVMCEITESKKVLGDTANEKDLGAKFRKLFDALCNRGVTNFELFVVIIAVGNASFARHGPTSKPSIISGTKGSASLRVAELHCIGDCTGLRLKNKKDAKALGDIIKTGRVFDLQADPLAVAPPVLKRPSAVAQFATRSARRRRLN